MAARKLERELFSLFGKALNCNWLKNDEEWALLLVCGQFFAKFFSKFGERLAEKAEKLSSLNWATD